MSYNMLLQIISALCAFIIGLGVLAVVLSSGSDLTALATGLATVLMLSVVVIILAIISFIMFIISLIKFYQGKLEFGPDHDRNVTRGIIYWLLSFIIPLIGGGVAAAVMVMMMFDGSASEIANAVRVYIVVAMVMSIVAALFQTMMFKTFVKVFTTDEEPKFKTGTILIILNPIVGLIVGVLVIPADLNSVTANNMSNVSSIGGIVGLIGIWFFYQGYKSILGKMDAGIIRPMPMAPPMYPPGYAPPPMPPQPYMPPPQAPYQPPPPQAAPAPYSPPPPAPYPSQPAPPQAPQPPQYPGQY
jgi:hypothetical protein